MKHAPITVGLLWHSVNSDNLGVGALTAAHIALLESVARDMGVALRYKVMCWRDPGPVYISGENVEAADMGARDLLRPGGLYATARSCDLVLDISAGDSFADIYGARRYIFNMLGKVAILLASRPLVLSPQTIGPFSRWWARLFARLAMSAARTVVTRDALSSQYLRDLGLEHKLVEATDVAFRLPYDAPPARKSSPVRVGLNVSGLLFNGGYTQDNMFSLAADYPAVVRALCAHFTAMPDCELHLVGHVNSHTHVVEDDYRVAEALAAEFPGAIVAPRFESPSAAKSYIATMDFFAGARMHACIAAFSSGVPVVPMAYSRKFVGLFGTLGYEVLADCQSHHTDEIVRIVVDGFNARHKIAAQVNTGRKNADAKLEAYEAILRKNIEKLM